MTDRIARVLDRLTRADGVQGVLVVDAEAGVAVASDVTVDVREHALAALAGSLFSRTADASRTSGFGDVRMLQLDAAAGHVIVAGAGPLLVVALAEPGGQLGLVRAEAERAAEALRS